MDLISTIIVGVIAVAVGAAGMFFFLRNNPKYFNIDDMLKAERDNLLSLGKDKLASLKEKIEKLL